MAMQIYSPGCLHGGFAGTHSYYCHRYGRCLCAACDLEYRSGSRPLAAMSFGDVVEKVKKLADDRRLKK